ncbi:ROK family protein [Mycetocola saprophilus]|uniref:ROK family protein n=1 Tax=Mycetocola saprophilus TaxID=76636 RepID=UPI00068D3FB1|nr:ROK family protein [Mycetocola saprophilus]
MTRSPAPAATQQRASLQAVLEYAWDADIFTATDAVEATGLTRSTSIEVIELLIERGLLCELDNARVAGEYRKGRPSRRFAFYADRSVLIGVDAGRSHLTVRATNLRGVLLAQTTRRLDPSHESAPERRAEITAAIADTLVEARRERADILSICAGVPAPVDARGRSPEHREGFWQRMNPDLPELLGEWAPIVRVENDASLAALAEGGIGRAQGCEDYITLLAGDRLGSGVVLAGRLLRGAHGGVGETVAFDHVPEVGGAYGVGSRILEWAEEGWDRLPADHPLVRAGLPALSARAVLEQAEAGDAWSQAIVNRAGHLLARVAAVLGSLFNPALIIVSGSIADVIEPVLVIARESLADQLDLPAPELAASALGADVVVLGAVSGALRSARAGVLAVVPAAERISTAAVAAATNR